MSLNKITDDGEFKNDEFNFANIGPFSKILNFKRFLSQKFH